MMLEGFSIIICLEHGMDTWLHSVKESALEVYYT